MTMILDYIYDIPLNIDKENVYQLLVAADYLSMLGVLKLCCNFLKETLEPGNCIGTMLFAR
jgi:kelch-like protein 10